VTPDELAHELGVPAKTLRAWLRRTGPQDLSGSRWYLDQYQIAQARERYTPAFPPPQPVPRLTSARDDTLPSLGSLATWSEWLPLNAAVVLAPQEPGVYLARQAQGAVIYVGMAGERRGQGVRGRLKIYTSGKGLASGLGEAVFDRALADPDWLRARLAEVDAGEPRRAKEWGKAAIEWADVQVCWTTTHDRASALALELAALRTLRADPLWNRQR
jgi:hypothetical protein